MAGEVVKYTSTATVPVTEDEAAAATAAVREMLGPGQVEHVLHFVQLSQHALVNEGGKIILIQYINFLKIIQC